MEGKKICRLGQQQANGSQACQDRAGRMDGRTDGRTGRTPLAGRRGSGAGGEGEGRTCSSVTFTDDISLKREIKD